MDEVEPAKFPERVIYTRWPPPPHVVDRLQQLEFPELASPIQLIPIGDLQVVGALSDSVVQVIGWNTRARSVWLKDERVAHIREQRGSKAETRFCLKNMAKVVLEPQYWRPHKTHPRCVELMAAISGRPLLVGLKLVPQAEADNSPIDEIWVRTSHPLSIKILSADARIGTLRFKPVMGL